MAPTKPNMQDAALVTWQQSGVIDGHENIEPHRSGAAQPLLPVPPASMQRLCRLPTPARAPPAPARPSAREPTVASVAEDQKRIDALTHTSTEHVDCRDKHDLGNIQDEYLGQTCGDQGLCVIYDDLASAPSSARQLSSSSSQCADPQYVKEYAPDVLRSMLQRELYYMASANCLQHQLEITARMRSILVDWLFEVQRTYVLRRNTLFLAVNLSDRFLSVMRVDRDSLQLLGVTCLMIASKFEDIDPPEIADFVYVTANTYTSDDILEMELSILNTLNFKVAGPTASHFLEYFNAYDDDRASVDMDDARRQCARWGVDVGNNALESLTWYALELSLLDVGTLRRAPSHVAAASLLLARRLSGARRAWPPRLARLSGYVERELEACAADLMEVMHAALQQGNQGVSEHNPPQDQ